MLISIGSDHAGFELKQQLLTLQGFSFLDEGCFSPSSVDYPDYAQLVVKRILEGEAEFGVLICGTGIGMSIAANRFKGIRAALCVNPEYATLARKHNNANILVLGGRMTDFDTAKSCLDRFFNTPFEEGRHENRIQKIDS